MFLREIKSRGKTYLVIVESYRDDGKVKHRSIASLGCLDYLQDSEQIKKLAMSLLKYYRGEDTIYDINKISEKDRKKWGYVKVIRKLWEMFGLDEILGRAIKDKKIKFDFFSAVFLMLLDRLREPKSKLATYNRQGKYHGIKKNKLQHLYRALDILSDKKEEIELFLFEKNKSLFNLEVDVCLYDVSTLFFESIEKDELREFGFSKDCKINEVQVVLGLLVDLEGRPIGFDLFPGSTYEGNTLKKALDKLKDKFKINRLIFVGDQAICSKKNLEMIKEKGFSYIVGSRIKTKAEEIKEKILQKGSYVKIKVEEEDEILKYREIKVEGEKLICTWSKKRAEKDKKDRERLIKKAEEIVSSNKSKVISKRGAMKYVNVKAKEIPTLNEQKILEDARWDGFYGIQTNCEDFNARAILGFYHDLWRIEESFRILKTHLETRPIFVWTAKRVKGHIVLCFIAFLLERTLEIQLKKNNLFYSPQVIREALDELEFSEIKIDKQIFYLRSNVKGPANKILRSFCINIPPAITSPEKFN